MSYDFVKETVPTFKKRYGDRVIAGSNNSIIILGTDREGQVRSGHGSEVGAGSINMIVGRSSEDIDMMSDLSFVSISMKGDVDDYLGLSSVEFNSQAVPCAVMKSDSIRLVARNDLKIRVGQAYITMQSDGRIVLDGNVELGSGASERLIRGDKFMTFFNSHAHPGAAGPTGNPIIQMTPDYLSPQKRTD